MKYLGGCLCGAVTFEIDGPLRDVVHCHCSMCRKAQGGAFATNGVVDAVNFAITSGEDQLQAYQSSPGKRRFFCGNCGSPIMSKMELRPEQLRVRLGTIDTDINERPEAHIFVGAKANWEEICGDLPQYQKFEPGR
jgi:hypothetical protein